MLELELELELDSVLNSLDSPPYDLVDDNDLLVDDRDDHDDNDDCLDNFRTGCLGGAV